MAAANLEITYQELLSNSKDVEQDDFEFSQRKMHCTDIGTYNERSLSLGNVRINEINTQFNRECSIAVSDRSLSQSLHLCLPVGGTVSGTFQDAGINATLKPRTHHYMFTPGYEYELRFAKEVRLAHVEFGLEYFKSLLCHSERWSADLHDKFFNQEVVYSGGSLHCKTTNDIVHAILHCPLTGNLRKIFLEAKILELVAIQLDHYRKLNDNQIPSSLKKADRDLMNEVRLYLSSNYKEEHSLKSISLHFGVNEFKLKKNFKLQFGQTIFDYLFDLKMEHAYRLLNDGGMLVNEVSSHVGYKNPNHFATAFAKKFGVSPSKLKA